MNLTLILSLLPFAAVMSITPGPNNLLVAASGVNFGFRRTIPHMFGVAIGFPLLLAGIGYGLGALIVAHPALATLPKYGGCSYLLYTAYKLAMTTKASAVSASAVPISFLEAVLFQWINPKAWVMAISTTALYANLGHDRFAQIALMCGVLGGMSMVAVVIWAVFGAAIARRLQDSRSRRVFNCAMATALVISLLPMLLH